MKKLLALVLVLAISASASAGVIDLQISGRGAAGQVAPINPVKEIGLLSASEYLWIDVVYTGDSPLYAMDSYFQVTGPGTIALTELTYPTGAWDSGWTSTGTDGGGTFIYLNAGITFAGVADGVAVDHILFHCEGPGDVTIVPVMSQAHGGGMDFDGVEPTVGTGVVIHQIPEPFTMALMGLGGLVALRRKH